MGKFYWFYTNWGIKKVNMLTLPLCYSVHLYKTLHATLPQVNFVPWQKMDVLFQIKKKYILFLLLLILQNLDNYRYAHVHLFF